MKDDPYADVMEVKESKTTFASMINQKELNSEDMDELFLADCPK
ncbi:hypothetical protein ACFL0V_03515 [Nanoarchaeota archaeon]